MCPKIMETLLSLEKTLMSHKAVMNPVFVLITVIFMLWLTVIKHHRKNPKQIKPRNPPKRFSSRVKYPCLGSSVLLPVTSNLLASLCSVMDLVDIV